MLPPLRRLFAALASLLPTLGAQTPAKTIPDNVFGYRSDVLTAHTQLASVPAWNDDAHVAANRDLYRQKFDAVLPILEPVLKVSRPEAAFYLWPDVGEDDESFARRLHARENVLALPGTYLARDNAGRNPGKGRVRLSLVASVADCVEAAQRIRRFIEEGA